MKREGGAPIVHDGHRSRLRRKFLEHGFDALDSHNILELLLFYSIPRGDTNVTAHLLMNRFKNIAGVCEAPESELMEVPGVGAVSARLIKLIPELAARYSTSSRSDPPYIISSAVDARDQLLPRFEGESGVTYLLCLDGKGKMIGCRRLERRAADPLEIDVRLIVETALRDNATAVILAHDHPPGSVAMTETDITATDKIKAALELVGVRLYDHLIYDRGGFISIMSEEFFKYNAGQQ